MARTKTKPVGRTPTKRRDCEAWLRLQLAAAPCLARDVLILGANSGWGWATVRRAKASMGAQSFRKGEEWWWFDPREFDPRKDELPGLSQQEPIAAPALEALVVTPTVAHLPSQQSHQSAVFPAHLPVATEAPAIASQNSVEAPRFPQQTLAPPALPKPIAPAAVPPAAPSALPKPPASERPRPFHIWDTAHREKRNALISGAGFADLYNMLLDVRFRQEQLRARGLFKEEAALNEVLALVVDALERKKKAESLE